VLIGSAIAVSTQQITSNYNNKAIKIIKIITVERIDNLK
jgi:hypothetical protein